MTPALQVVSPEAWAKQVAGVVAEALRAAGGERVSLALTGGKGVAPVYRQLAREDAPWERVDFFWGDERCVPPDDPESNYRLARDTLLDAVVARDAQVFRMEGERADRDAAASDYAARLPAALDVVLLGLGEDGHVCSLFPNHPALQERERKVLHVTGPKAPHHRLTLTLPALRAARRVIGLTAGTGKREALRRLMAGEDIPAARVPRAEWWVDMEAAPR